LSEWRPGTGRRSVDWEEIRVAGSRLTDLYVDLLLDRVRQETFPNPEHLDRIEASVQSPEQVLEYVELLLSKVEGMRYPSLAILDRIQRFATMR
jgi:hypothetical protein